jgi:hypothetical protein
MPNEATPENEAPPSPASRPSPRRMPAPLSTPDRVTAAFTVVLALATLALVVTAIIQHFDTVDAVEATKRLAIANENAASDRRHTASAEFILKMNDTLDQHRFDNITDEIQSHNGTFHLPEHPNQAEADVEEYLSALDDIGYFVKENLIESKMAYEEFSYDIEKAWCNITVQETIHQERATDKSKIALIEPIFGDFEILAKDYLKTDGLSCKDLDAATTRAAKKKMIKKRRRAF